MTTAIYSEYEFTNHLRRLTHISTTNCSSGRVAFQETEKRITGQACSTDQGSTWSQSEKGAKRSDVQTKKGRIECMTRARESDWLGGHLPGEFEEGND